MSSLVCIEKKLCDIEALLSGDLTVQPGDQWAALLESAVSAALENTEITIGNQPLSVTIDTSDGPIEVTGELAVTQSGDWTVSVDNFPTSISVDNFEDIGTVNVNLESQDNPIEVELTGPQQQLLINIADAINATIRVQYEPTGNCVYTEDATGNLVPREPVVRQFAERRYTNTGVFISESIVLSEFPADGSAPTSYPSPLALPEVLKKCGSSSDAYLSQIVDLLTDVIGTPDDKCGCDNEDEVTDAFAMEAAWQTNATKFNLDDPGASNAYGSVNSNWTAADLAAALNASAANAVPPTIPSGVDYSTTVWTSGVTLGGVEYVKVQSGPVPATLDLVSIPVSIPVSTI